MRKFLTLLLIILLLGAACAVALTIGGGGLKEIFSQEPAYDEELYKSFREAEARGDYTAMNAAFDENMAKTGVSFFDEDYDPTHGGLIYSYDYSAKISSKKTVSGKLYIISGEIDRTTQTAGSNDYFVLDRRAVSDPEFKVFDSYRADTDAVIKALCELLLEHEEAYPTAWERSLDSMVSEWKMHNLSYALGYKVERSQHVNLNNADEGEDWIKRAMEEFK